MKKQCGISCIELMMMTAILGILAIVLLPSMMNQSNFASFEQAMDSYVKTLYQPVGQVRVFCAENRCTAVFSSQGEQERTVIAVCTRQGCSALPSTGK